MQIDGFAAIFILTPNGWANHTPLEKASALKGNNLLPLVGLGFNCLVNTIKAMSSPSVYLSTPFLCRLSPFCG